jgi:hypothetical protein
MAQALRRGAHEQHQRKRDPGEADAQQGVPNAVDVAQRPGYEQHAGCDRPQALKKKQKKKN